MGRFKVRRLMEELGLEARYPKKYRNTTDSNHKLDIAPNIPKVCTHLLRAATPYKERQIPVARYTL